VLLVAVLLAGLAGLALFSRDAGREGETSERASSDGRAQGRPGGEPGLARSSRRGPGAPAPPGAPTSHRVSIVARDVAGEPVPDVVVQLRPEDGRDRATPPTAEATTDATGVAVVSLPPGEYRVGTRHSRLHGEIARLEVPREERAVLEMVVGVPLRVRVRDAADRRPLADATVSLVEFGQGVSVRTGADGVADLGAIHGTWEAAIVKRRGYLPRFEWLTGAWKRRDGLVDVPLKAAGPLTVRVSRPDATPEPGASVWVSHSGGDARGTADETGTVHFTEGSAPPAFVVRATAVDQRRGETRVEGSPAEVLVVVDAGRAFVGIAVREHDHRPVPDAVVFAQDHEGTWREVAHTGLDGRFSLERIPGRPDDPIDVRVRAVGWAGPDEATEVPDDEEEGWGLPLGVTLRFPLDPTYAIAGRVVGPDREPVFGAKVVVSSPSSAPLALSPLEATTDAQGRYRIEDVPRWDGLAVIAETEGFGVQETYVPEPVADVAAVEVEDLVLPGTFAFDVPVVDEAGRPVPLAWLVIRQRVVTQGERQWWRTVEDGRFHPLPGLSREGVVVDVTAPGFLPDVLRADAATSSLVATRAVRVRGRVVSEEGRPVAKAKVRLESKDRLSTLEGNAGEGETDDAGAFEVGGVRRGRYDLRVAGTTREVRIVREEEDVGDVVVDAPPR
jgi:hypothetical protein